MFTRAEPTIQTLGSYRVSNPFLQPPKCAERSFTRCKDLEKPIYKDKTVDQSPQLLPRLLHTDYLLVSTGVIFHLAN